MSGLYQKSHLYQKRSKMNQNWLNSSDFFDVNWIFWSFNWQFWSINDPSDLLIENRWKLYRNRNRQYDLIVEKIDDQIQTAWNPNGQLFDSGGLIALPYKYLSGRLVSKIRYSSQCS